jgi:hypothetical protein
MPTGEHEHGGTWRVLVGHRTPGNSSETPTP